MGGTAWPAPRRTTVSRLYLLTVIKVAVVLWTLARLLISAVAAAWAFLTATSAVDSAERFIVDSTGMEDFEILSQPILTALVMLVGLFVLVAVTCTVATAVLTLAHDWRRRHRAARRRGD
jgi:hypothetical protein